jgi:hypothetical protein
VITDEQIADSIIRTAQAIITHRGQLGGWERLDKNVCKTFGCNYGSWASDPDSGAPETTTFNIEYGVFFDCERTATTECDRDCDGVDTVNVQIGWTGLTEESACAIMQYIDDNVDRLTPDFWLGEDK